ncbi:sulfotransferase 1C4-like [Saccoglossus kowalevskii]|uniref:Sulfotransferase 1C4-like n=1 Tax=Saccoglossus kowalevskii TaxID=10224 RepID=A0ABM0MJS7_SACKO|nr:PREDICTED: sulfotransferase 1C4-like [Saccoglossus kowalevskii]
MSSENLRLFMYGQFVEAEDCNYYSGIVYPKCVPFSVFNAMSTFTVRDDDVWLLSYPKAGAAWMMEIAHHIAEYESHATDVVLFPEFAISEHEPNYEVICETQSPRFIASHLQGSLLPPQLGESNAKIIYIARNPKDVAVSLYNHYQVDTAIPNVKSWDVFFDAFIRNAVVFGSWADHTLYWWQRREKSNVLFITYEEFKQNRKNVMNQIREFLGKEIETSILDDIDKKSVSKRVLNKEQMKEASRFPKQGNIGMWKRVFTKKQNELFDREYAAWIGNSGLKLKF